MSDITPFLPALLALIIAGGVAGFIAGLLGVGGGIVLVPALYYIFSALGYGSDALIHVCIATSMATIVLTSMRSTQAHHAKGAVLWDVLRGWAAGLGIGSVGGVIFATAVNGFALQIIFSILAIFISLYMLFSRSDWAIADHLPRGVFVWIASPIVGFLSVLLGIGGGSFAVPILSLHRVPMHNAVATAAGFGGIIASSATLIWLWVGLDAPTPPLTFGGVNLPAFAVITVMTYICAPLGAKMAHRLDAAFLKRIFSVFLMLVALDMIKNALNL